MMSLDKFNNFLEYAELSCILLKKVDNFLYNNKEAYTIIDGSHKIICTYEGITFYKNNIGVLWLDNVDIYSGNIITETGIWFSPLNKTFKVLFEDNYVLEENNSYLVKEDLYFQKSLVQNLLDKEFFDRASEFINSSLWEGNFVSLRMWIDYNINKHDIKKFEFLFEKLKKEC